MGIVQDLLKTENVTRVLKPTVDNAANLQNSINTAYKNHREALKEIEEYYNSRVHGLTNLAGEKTLANVDDFINLTKEYADAIAEQHMKYYAVNRELWQYYTDNEFKDYAVKRASADRAVYDYVRGFSDTDFNGITWKQVMTGNNRAGKTISDLWGKALEGVDLSDAEKLTYIAQDIARRSGRLTTELTARYDPTKPCYARVPQGEKTCAFCYMLASRGFVYGSEDKAKFKHGGTDTYHMHCDCLPVPTWGRAAIQGYNPREMYKNYREAYEITKDMGKSTTEYKNILSVMRRNNPILKDAVIKP